MTTCKFTIFTASYNRAHTLPKLFNSLEQQKFKDFEWLIVDDGSTDHTRELLTQLEQSADFPIHCLTQKHQGKMRAHNAALPHINGLFFLNVDSDDYLYPNTLERLWELWDGIPPDKKQHMAGLACLSADPANKIIGNDFGVPFIDSSFDNMYQQGRMHGDRLELWLSDLIRQFPYPCIPNEYFVPDGLIFHQISRKYLVRFINEPLQIVVYQPDGITRNSIHYRSNNPKGMMYYYQDMLQHLTSRKEKLRCSVNLYRYYMHDKNQKNTHLNDLIKQPSLMLKSAGYLLYFSDKTYLYIRRKNFPLCA